MKTAVEWLYNQQIEYPLGDWGHFFEQAKEMEKQQIIEAFNKSVPFKFGEQYYNETFKK